MSHNRILLFSKKQDGKKNRRRGHRPLLLADAVRPERARRLSRRVNLTLPTPRVPASFVLQTGFALVAGWLLLLGSVSAPTTETLAANTPTEERAALEAQLQELESQIGEYQDQIKQYEKQGKTLKGEINRLNAQIAKTNLQIRAVNLTLSQLTKKIGTTEEEIKGTEASIAANEAALGELVRQLYQAEDATFVEVFLRNPTLSDFFNELNALSVLQLNLQNSIARVRGLKDELELERDELLLARSDVEASRIFQEAQRVEAARVKDQKDDLLSITKGQESKYQDLLTKTKEDAAKIRNRLFELLGGGELTFEEAYAYAKLAGDATGVRPAFILAILDRESALGQNVGRCKYNQIISSTGKPAMHPTRDVPPFLEITAKLGLNPESVVVSCPNKDGTYGGAMGPAQFIPSTWKGYEKAVAGVTGRSPASPWNNGDAFVAAALYLKDSGAASSERNAAAKYYCGGNWRRSVCTNVYGAKVVDRAAQFQKDIDIIS